MQQSLFDGNGNNQQRTLTDVPSADRFQATLLFGAVGDSLGWPTEFLSTRGRRRPPFSFPVRDFVRWRKMVGGRWWGYLEEIGPGEYSDDTQLTLAVARSINRDGQFQPETFAYSEMPLWLHYERGGGRSVKAAARNLLRRQSAWDNNFFRTSAVDFRSAGANGAAMRMGPIALTCVGSEEKLIADAFLNTVITHGHPRAIFGAILIGLAIRFELLANEHAPPSLELADYLLDSLPAARTFIRQDKRAQDWIDRWQRRKPELREPFLETWDRVQTEVEGYLSIVDTFGSGDQREYYERIGALNPQTKGSGTSSVCAALFQYLKPDETPLEKVLGAVNTLDSDTDTIAAFVGALVGARSGLGGLPSELTDKVQDREYLLRMGSRLNAIAAGASPTDHVGGRESFSREQAYVLNLAWEIGLHEMFWDALGEGDTVVHPALGAGRILSKDVRDIVRGGYVAKLISIKFECGQSCTFHSRVSLDSKVSESLASELEGALSWSR